jgi:hypothetical protein
MAGKMSVQMEPIEKAKDNGSPGKQEQSQKLRKRGEDDDVKAAKSRAVGEGVGPGRKSKACRCDTLQ